MNSPDWGSIHEYQLNVGVNTPGESDPHDPKNALKASEKMRALGYFCTCHTFPTPRREWGLLGNLTCGQLI